VEEPETRPIEGINCKKIESTGKPDFSLFMPPGWNFCVPQEVARMKRDLKSPTSLEKDHRGYLLKLQGLAK
jgi:hypothetical protein